MTIRVRFAPSPTGHLHVGNARTALFNWLFAKKNGGCFILRIEDTDILRSEERFENLIYDDLSWLGLDWQEGPDVGGPFASYRQSDRLNLYREKAEQLVAEGKAYYCFCSEAELEAQASKAKEAGKNWRYPGTCQSLAAEEVRRRLEAKQPAVIRLKVRPGDIRFDDMVHGPMSFSSEVVSDLILIRSNGLPTYNYAVVVDDALMDITHVIRGDDHLSNTPKQVLIFEAFGWKRPAFAHLSTILGSDHSRLSKRHGATSIQNFQEMGILPEAMMNYMALLGWAHEDGKTEILSTGQLQQVFELERVSKSPAVFDMEKLYWINRHYMKECPRSRLIELAVPFLQKRLIISQVTREVLEWVGLLVDAELNTLDKLDDLPGKVDETCRFEAAEAIKTAEVQEVLAEPGARQVIQALLDQLNLSGSEVLRDWETITANIKMQTGQKGKNLFHPLRVALTGKASGREMDKLIAVYENGSRLALPQLVKNCRQRVSEFWGAIQ